MTFPENNADFDKTAHGLDETGFLMDNDKSRSSILETPFKKSDDHHELIIEELPFGQKMKGYLQKRDDSSAPRKTLNHQTEARLRRNKTDLKPRKANIPPVEMPARIESASTNQFESGNQNA